MPTVAFLGPAGTFTEEALLTQADLADGDLVGLASMRAVLDAVETGAADLGFVPIENSIEGTVRESSDHLIFETDLLVQREVVLPIRQNLLAPAGATLAGVGRVVSYPEALGQCRQFFADHLPDVVFEAATSTAEAVRTVAERSDPSVVAVGTALAAKLYGLDVLAGDIEDHPDNATRFLLVARGGVPPETGHDKTSIVCFQHADRPGSLLGILQEFSARSINLSNLQSRPTKTSLGDYCFLIDFEGHVADEVVADCLKALHAQLPAVKFLGSYPAAGAHGPALRREAVERWRNAEEWVSRLRAQLAD